MTLAVTTSCVDDDELEFAFERPASLAGYEYLADYDALKTYVDRSATPNFKLGGALAASDYNARGLVTRLANMNFDEVVTGNDMKMATGFPDRLLEAMEKGVLTREDMEKAAENILTLILRID